MYGLSLNARLPFALPTNLYITTTFLVGNHASSSVDTCTLINKREKQDMPTCTYTSLKTSTKHHKYILQ